jgi:hypothetical protein
MATVMFPISSIRFISIASAANIVAPVKGSPLSVFLASGLPFLTLDINLSF